MKKFLLAGGITFLVFVVCVVAISQTDSDTEADVEAEAEATEPVKTEEETVTERYAGWIEEFGRDRAGDMINVEIDSSFKAKDGRTDLLINAKSTAMLQDHERSLQKKAARDAELQEKINAQFSPWDGSHRGLVEQVKRILNDPSSFEHLETKTLRGGSWPETFLVRMDYTAKNAFGGRLRKFVLVEVSSESGLIIKVLNEG